MKIRKKVKLVFHVGYGRTATTTLQDAISKLPNVLFLGKGHFGGKKVFKNEIEDLHKHLFRPYRMKVVMGFANPSRSSNKLFNIISLAAFFRSLNFCSFVMISSINYFIRV